MKFELQEPHHALSLSAKTRSVETSVLLGLTLRSGWTSRGVLTTLVGCEMPLSAVGAQDSEVWY